MKTMLQFKQFDLGMQALLVIAGVLFGYFNTNDFIIVYLFVGGWQLLSVFIHLAVNRSYYYVAGSRKVYYKALLWTVGIGIITLPVFIIYLFVLLFASPLLALLYMYACNEEIKLLRKKLLVHIR